MLVEINLLPRKETRKYGFPLVLAGFASLFLLTAVFYFWQIHSTTNQLESVNKEITIANKIAASMKLQKNQNETSNSVSSLMSSINWVKASRIETVPVMDELTSLLPERGFILAYQSEAESGTVQLTVQFDSASDAAYYLNRLNHSKMFIDASILSLTDGSAAGSSRESNTTGNTANSNTVLKSFSSSLHKQELPRYTGQFTIMLDKKAILQTEDKKSGSKGVTGS